MSECENLVDILTLAIASIGVSGGLWALRQTRKQRQIELAMLYLQRYWQIDDDLLRFSKGSVDHRQARHRYLRLCEDEFEAARLKTFDRLTWETWHGWLARPESVVKLKGDLEICDPGENYFSHLRACVASRPGHKWKECTARNG